MIDPIARRRPARRRPNLRPSVVESLEIRRLLSNTFTVVSTQDNSERGTLRWAIEQVNRDATDSSADPDLINFAIKNFEPVDGLWTISPKIAPLPSLVRPAILDGTTQPGYASSPVIRISGLSLLQVGDGIVLAAGSDSSTIRGLIVSGFGQGNGIAIAGSGGNRIAGNRIEANADGITIRGSNSAGNTIGGTTDSARNILAGNTNDGIGLAGAIGNQIAGNWIGLDASGNLSPNGRYGISLTGGAGFNMIGGAAASARNVISGGAAGIALNGAGGNRIEGNFLGTTVDGESAAGSEIGIEIADGSGNQIADNLISGNRSIQVHLSGPAAGANTIVGNLIGTDATGQRTIGLSGNTAGILIEGAPGNTVGPGNVLAGFTAGVYIAGGGASGNAIVGNDIGTNEAPAGTPGLGNTVGVYINGAPNNTVGGAGALRNVISGNSQAGVYLYGSLANGNRVLGNIIGLAPDGVSTFRSASNGAAFVQSVGVAIVDASRNTIGGDSGELGNVLTGNQVAGVYILGHGGSGAGNLVESNLIGLNADGSRGAGNAQYGVLLYNASNNTVVRRGSMSNRFGGNGTANVRIYVGPELTLNAQRAQKLKARTRQHSHRHRPIALTVAVSLRGVAAVSASPGTGRTGH